MKYKIFISLAFLFCFLPSSVYLQTEINNNQGMVFYQKIKDKKLKFTQLVGAHGAIGDISDLKKAYQLRMQGNKN